MVHFSKPIQISRNFDIKNDLFFELSSRQMLIKAIELVNQPSVLILLLTDNLQLIPLTNSEFFTATFSRKFLDQFISSLFSLQTFLNIIESSLSFKSPPAALELDCLSQIPHLLLPDSICEIYATIS